jgi:hypothetical protein
MGKLPVSPQGSARRRGIYRKCDFSGCGVFRRLYPFVMREEELPRYFIGEASVSQLAKDISGSVVKVDDLQSEIRIADMQGSFSLQRDHVIRLSEACLDRAGSSCFQSFAAGSLISRQSRSAPNTWWQTCFQKAASRHLPRRMVASLVWQRALAPKG